jgi:hypothetical protein
VIWNGICRVCLLIFVISGLTGCVNVDVNGYRQKAAAPGQGHRIACAGNCR